VDFAGLDTERMEMKSLLDDNFRRFSKRFTYLESFTESLGDALSNYMKQQKV